MNFLQMAVILPLVSRSFSLKMEWFLGTLSWVFLGFEGMGKVLGECIGLERISDWYLGIVGIKYGRVLVD
jgi:hypothetical protein